MGKMPRGESRDDGRTQLSPLGKCMQSEEQALRENIGKSAGART